MVNCRWLFLLSLAVSSPLYADVKQKPIDIAIQSRQFALAETLLRQQIQLKPTDWDVHFRLAKVLSWQNKFKEAELEYRMLLAREPSNSDYLQGLAQVCLWRGDARTALPLIESAKSLSPGDPDIWRLHIQTLAAINNEASYHQALIIQKQAVVRFPELKWNIVTNVKPVQTVAASSSGQGADVKQTPIDIAIQSKQFALAETLLRQQIQLKPTDWDVHFRLAKVLSWQNKFKEAELEYKMLLAREPSNSDYLQGLAQVCLWRGDARTALPLIESAKSLSPGDPDIWRLHIQTLAAINNEASYHQALIIQKLAVVRFPELKWNIVTNVKPVQTVATTGGGQDPIFDLIHRNQIELGGSYDHLSKNKGFWRSEYLSFEHRFAPQQVVYGIFTQTERFYLNDEQFLLGGYYPLLPKLTLNLEGNVSPSPQVLASNSIMASLQAGLGYNWFLTGGFRHSEYSTGPMQQGFAILETYFADFRAAYTVRVTDSLNRTQFGHTFNLSYYYQDTSYITLSYSMGAENSGFQGVVLDTQAFGIYGRHWFNQDWALSWALAHIEQGGAYNREGVSLGIRRAF